MSKLLISYCNDADNGTVTASSEHPSFPAINVQQRWFQKTWRSKYGAGSAWGLFRVKATNCIISFDEGGGTLTATLTIGDYDTTTICAEIKTQMEAAGALTYTPSYSDTTKKITIAGSGNFILKLSVVANSAFPMLGWIAIINTANAATHTAPLTRIHTEEYIYCNLGSTKTIKFLALKNHNLQSTAIITACYYSDAFVTEVATDNIPWHAGTMAIRLSRSYRYMAFKISDPGNPDFYVEIGRAWVGDEFVPHYGYNPEHGFVPQDPSVISSSDDGQESSIQRSHFAEWDYSFDAMTAADRVTFAALFALIGSSLPCFIVEAPAVSDVGLTAKYIRFISWEEAHVAGAIWSLALAVRLER